MRFAIDACVPEQLAEALRALGADVITGAGTPAMPDEEVLSGAVGRDRVLITSDKDFGDLVFRDGKLALIEKDNPTWRDLYEDFLLPPSRRGETT